MDEDVTGAVRAVPSEADGEMADLWRRMPPDVAASLTWLAHLIDASLPLRTVIDDHEYAQRFLGVPAAGVIALTEELGPFSAPVVSRALATDLRRTPPAGMAGRMSDASPTWDRLDLDGTVESVPRELVAAFEAGTLLEVPVVVSLCPMWQARRLTVFVRDRDVAAGEAYLHGLVERGRGPENHLRGRCVEVRDADEELAVRIVPTPDASRSEVIVPDALWRCLDGDVAGLFDRSALLGELGLSSNRGVLLAGAPGTGKSALCRVLAAELAGRVTVVFCTAKVLAGHLGDVYEELTRLAPALVILEDLDLVVGSRDGGGGGPALHGFLAALDGAASRHRDVVTLATTNDPRALDEAAVRSARFDRIVEVPLPSPQDRAAILRRYLGRLTSRVEVGRVAAATAGSTGADLRELVQAAVLADGEEISTAGLLGLAADRRTVVRDIGAYL